jgi:hypothetical protein
VLKIKKFNFFKPFDIILVSLLFFVILYLLKSNYLKSIDEWVYLYHIKKIDFKDMWIPSYTYFFVEKVLLFFSPYDFYLTTRIFNFVFYTLSCLCLFYSLLKTYSDDFKVGFLTLIISPSVYYIATLTPESISFSLILLFLSALISFPKNNILHILLLLLITTTKVQLLLLPFAYLFSSIYYKKRAFNFLFFTILYASLYYYVSNNTGDFASGYKGIFLNYNRIDFKNITINLLAYISIIIIILPPLINFNKLNMNEKSLILISFLFISFTLLLVSTFTSLANYDQSIAGIKIHSRYLQGSILLFIGSWIFLDESKFRFTKFSKIYTSVSTLLFIISLFFLYATPLSTFDAPDFSAFNLSYLHLVIMLMIRLWGAIQLVYFENIQKYKISILFLMLFCFIVNIFSELYENKADKLDVVITKKLNANDYIGNGIIFTNEIVDELRIRFYFSNVNFDDNRTNTKKCTQNYDLCIGYKTNYECNFNNKLRNENIFLCYK